MSRKGFYYIVGICLFMCYSYIPLVHSEAESTTLEPITSRATSVSSNTTEEPMQTSSNVGQITSNGSNANTTDPGTDPKNQVESSTANNDSSTEMEKEGTTGSSTGPSLTTLGAETSTTLGVPESSEAPITSMTGSVVNQSTNSLEEQTEGTTNTSSSLEPSQTTQRVENSVTTIEAFESSNSTSMISGSSTTEMAQQSPVDTTAEESNNSIPQSTTSSNMDPNDDVVTGSSSTVESVQNSTIQSTDASAITLTDQRPRANETPKNSSVLESVTETNPEPGPTGQNESVDEAVPPDYSEAIQALRDQLGVSCPLGFYRIGGVCFLIHNETLTYKEAFNFCQDNLGRLASPNHHLTWLALFESSNSSEEFWTGFKISEHQEVYNAKGHRIGHFPKAAMIFKSNSSQSKIVGLKNQLNPVIFRDKAFELGDPKNSAGVICQQTELRCSPNFTLVDGTCMQIVSGDSVSAAESSCSDQTNGDGQIIVNSHELCARHLGNYTKEDASQSRNVAIRDQLTETFVWMPSESDLGSCSATRIRVLPANETESEMVQFEREACNRQTFQVVCSDPIQVGSSAEDPSFTDQKSICTHSPHFGDISCDFESPLWNEGYCLWNIEPAKFQWKTEPAPEEVVPTVNHFVRVQGPGLVVLESGTIFECSRVRSSSFGMLLRSEGLLQASVRFEKLLWNGLLDGMGQVHDLGTVSIEFSIEGDGFVELDDLGPCHFYDYYDPSTKTCFFRSNQSGPKDDGTCSDLRRMGQISAMNPDDGLTLAIKSMYPNESRWDHINVANSIGERLFHVDGAKTTDSMAIINSTSGGCGSYQIKNSSESHLATDCGSMDVHSYCQYPSAIQSTKRLLGCWGNIGNHSQPNTVVEDPFMSIQMCSTICKGQGSPIGLVQRLTGNRCTRPCPGEPYQTCGGFDEESKVPYFTAININANGFASPSTCLDHFKLGLLPTNGCHNVINSEQENLECCYSKVDPDQTKVCKDGFLGLGDSCFKLISGSDLRAKSVFDINAFCQSQEAHLVQELNGGNLTSLMSIFKYHPLFRPTEKNQDLTFRTGAFIIPANPKGAMNGSCYEFVFNGSIEIHRSSCFDLSGRRAYLCQAAKAPTFKIAKLNESSPFSQMADILYDHPMMSQTACSAFCFGKGTKTTALVGHSCYCLKDDVDKLQLSTNESTEPKLLPCPGNPIQFCGFEEADKWALVVDSRDEGVLDLGFKSCDELKAANVFMDAKFKINGKMEHCNNWKGPCSNEEYLYGKQCIMIPELFKKFDDAEKACSNGQEMLQDPTIGFWAEIMGLGSKSAFWGGKNESDCFVSDGSFEDCETKKKFICARPICPKPQSLIAGMCLTIEGAESPCQPGTGVNDLPGVAPDQMKALKIVATQSNSETTNPVCFKELPCPIGSHMLSGGKSCLIALPKPTPPKNPKEVCKDNGAHLPMPLTSTNRSDLAEAVKTILARKDENFNLTGFKIEIGLRGSVHHPFSVLSDGTYATEGFNATTPTYPGFAYQFSIDNPDSFISIVEDDREPTEQDYNICVQEMSKKGMCFTKSSLESDLQHSVVIKDSSAYECSIYCLNHDMKYGAIMSQDEEEKTSTCACLGADVSLAEKEVATTCTSKCGLQTCGREDSMAIYSTTDLDVVYETCEMAMISSPILRDLDTILLKSPKTGIVTKVNCPFESKEVCQQPLLSTLDHSVDSLFFNGEKQSSAKYLSQVFTEPGFVTPKNLTLKVIFGVKKTLRHLTTAWEVLGMRFGDSEEEITNDVLSIDGIKWTFEPEQSGMAEQIPLPKTLMANAVEIDLHRRNVSQFNPFFEIRGCDFAEAKSTPAPTPNDLRRKKRNARDPGVEVRSGGRLYSFKQMDDDSQNYMSAQSLCGDAKLVTINSKVKALEIARALQEDTESLGSYVIGLKKLNKIWTHSNGQQLSNYQNWANAFNQTILNEDEEPQVDKECAKVMTDQLTSQSNPLPWIATDCEALEVEGALCEISDPNTQFPELEKLECLLKDNTDSWFKMSNSTTNASDCMSACIADEVHWQWSIFEPEGCSCLKFIENGFLPKAQCLNANNQIPVVTAYRLWKLGCSRLPDLQHKNLLLTYHHQYYLNTTHAVYECKAGYTPDPSTPTTNLNLTCQNDFQWSLDPNETLPACVPITCPPPLEPTFAKGWNMSHRLHYGQNQSVISTSFQAFCPKGLKFENNETQFETKCTGQDTWTVSSTLGCRTPENVTVSNMTRFQCSSLPWENLNCSVPDCTQDIWDELDVTNAEAEVLDKFLVAKTPGSSGVVRCSNSSATFRSITNTSFSLGNITATCIYESNATSKWSYFDEGVKRTSLPKCDFYCPSEPQSPGTHMTRDWNGNRWADGNVTYKCDEGLSFNHKGANSSDVQIVANCRPNPDGTANQWALSLEGTTLPTMPQCVAKCDMEPPLDEALFIRTWNMNQTVGAKAQYTCIDPDQNSFFSSIYYPIIEMTCKQYPGESKGEWVWNNMGTDRTEMPSCQPSSSCQPLQDFFDDEITFDLNLDFIVRKRESFINVEGHNAGHKSGPGAKIKAKCQFEPELLVDSEGAAHEEMELQCQDLGNQTSKWIWLDPRTGEQRMDSFDCKARCKLESPSKAGFLKTTNERWVGSKTIYSCEDPALLIKKNATHGFDTVAIECVSSSRFEPWWINLEKLTECQSSLDIGYGYLGR
eukprot:TCALIF_06714-PA protein Name:"Protein of unknown function" AED:0.03 eAED:0.04 QI:78/0.84/0.79/0.97/0.65/0.74/39/0/2674